MSKPKVFEKPAGVKDYLPAAVTKLRTVEADVLQCMSRWGYKEIKTPTLEYYDTVGTASSISEDKLFKLLDRRGTALVMRSDMTAPIARVISSLLNQTPFPIRLSYHANVFRAMGEEAGRDAEFFQTGVELVGDGTADADAEIVALAVASIKAAGVRDFNVTMGHVGFLNGWFSETLPGQEEVQIRLKECLQQRDHVGYRYELAQLMLDTETHNKLESVLRLHGGAEVCDQALSMTTSDDARQALLQLCEVMEVLRSYGVSEYVRLDLTMISGFSYYTGMLFEGYATGHGFPIASGGRYDNLLEQFGRSAPATGFALKTNRIIEIVDHKVEDTVNRVLVIYDATGREEALQHVCRLRQQPNKIVETRRLDYKPEWPVTEAKGIMAESGTQNEYTEVIYFTAEQSREG